MLVQPLSGFLFATEQGIVVVLLTCQLSGLTLRVGVKIIALKKNNFGC